jgi:hypothetical protein
LPLLVGMTKGDTSISLVPANAASLAPDDYVLLFSNKPVDTGDPHKHAGEVKQIEIIDLATGKVTFDDQIYDGYLADVTAANARAPRTNEEGRPNPVSGRLYAVGQSPKRIIIRAVPRLRLRSTEPPTGLAGVFKLSIGETIWSAMA